LNKLKKSEFCETKMFTSMKNAACCLMGNEYKAMKTKYAGFLLCGRQDGETMGNIENFVRGRVTVAVVNGKITEIMGLEGESNW
jgi:hypothetical protein